MPGQPTHSPLPARTTGTGQAECPWNQQPEPHSVQAWVPSQGECAVQKPPGRQQLGEECWARSKLSSTWGRSVESEPRDIKPLFLEENLLENLQFPVLFIFFLCPCFLCICMSVSGWKKKYRRSTLLITVLSVQCSIVNYSTTCTEGHQHFFILHIWHFIPTEEWFPFRPSSSPWPPPSYFLLPWVRQLEISLTKWNHAIFDLPWLTGLFHTARCSLGSSRL